MKLVFPFTALRILGSLILTATLFLACACLLHHLFNHLNTLYNMLYTLVSELSNAHTNTYTWCFFTIQVFLFYSLLLFYNSARAGKAKREYSAASSSLAPLAA